MKVKNIMFSGVMASILMMGGAYAANNANDDLATAGFVRGAYNAAVAQAIDNLAEGNGVTITTTGTGDAATATIAINTDVVATNSDVAEVAGRVTTAEGEIDTLQSDMTTAKSDISGLKTTVGDASSGLVKDVADLKSSSASASDLTALSGRVTTAEGEIDTLQSDMTTAKGNITTLMGADTVEGSVAKAEKDAKDYADTLNTAMDARMDTAETEIAGNTSSIGTINTALATKAAASDLTAETTARESADTAINNKIGTVAEGKTVVQMIADAQAAAEAADSDTTYTAGDGILIDPATGNAISADVDNISIKINANKKITLGYGVTDNTFSATAQQ